ncbi:tricalbin, C2 domain protein (phospholipid binding) ER-plasma membrane tethering protein Tcb1 [Schizosaccharomyces pombe]|uniref:Uncharacterized protein C962.01 n=1 Tax=Schizosaccharomyces pombe (strain 972 / ATCC 24843) TaxID=284812 RepID=YC31_SCHPO|nr:C2 domain protein [Schizosaccharomyces pombe]O14065.3 RecName: Full=Uncharacterized protein C962.01 [Schizosaccharomyces pombe 972h-]CAB58375.1 C2 domain protein [Schizosaccharomyces pombe]|eukprot:NP_587865.1 C2 domain protein [Schizosaccharomyces pombe]
MEGENSKSVHPILSHSTSVVSERASSSGVNGTNGGMKQVSPVSTARTSIARRPPSTVGSQTGSLVNAPPKRSSGIERFDHVTGTAENRPQTPSTKASVANVKPAGAAESAQNANLISSKSENVPEPAGEKVSMPEKQDLQSALPSDAVSNAVIGWKSIYHASDVDVHDHFANVLSALQWDSHRVEPSILETYSSYKLTGQWWQSTSILLAVSILSWIASKLWFRFFILFFIIITGTIVYGSCMISVRRNIREEVVQELSKKNGDVDYETMSWFNTLLQRFWMLNEPEISKSVSTSVEQSIAEYLPSFIKEAAFSTFTLGSKAPRIDRVRTHPPVERDVVLMDVDFSLTPNDNYDVNDSSLKCRVNSLISLVIKFGFGKYMFSFPITIKDLRLSGKLRIRWGLSSDYPFIQTASFSFLETPIVYANIRPIDIPFLDADIFYIPGIGQFVSEQLGLLLNSMVLWPNMFDYDLSAMMAGIASGTAVGVVGLKIYSARRGEVSDSSIDRKPSSFITVTTSGREHGRTPIRSNTFSPTFDTTIYVVINSLNDPLKLSLYDNSGKSPILVGTTYIDPRSLYERGFIGDIYQFLYNAVNVGSVAFDATFFPSLLPKKTMDGSKIEPPESSKGILNVNLGCVNNLTELTELTKKSSLKYVLYVDSKEVASKTIKFVDRTPISLQTNAYIENNKKSSIKVAVFDVKSPEKAIATVSVPLPELLHEGYDTFHFVENPKATIDIESFWTPVDVVEEKSAKTYIDNLVGVMRLSVIKANDLVNVELPTRKSDPYARVIVGNSVVARTVYTPNNLNPIWNEILYVPIMADTKTIDLEAMDYEESGNDRSLGYASINVQKYIRNAKRLDRSALASTVFGTSEVNALTLTSRKGQSVRGTISVNCDYRPCLRLNTDNSSKQSSENVQSATDPTTPAKDNSTSNAETSSITSVISVNEALQYPSGFALISIVSADLQDVGVDLRVFTDNAAFPFITTPIAKTKTPRWSSFGISMVRELQFSETTFQLTDGAKKDPKVVCEHSVKTLDLVSEALGRPYSVEIPGSNGQLNHVRLSITYMPVPMTLNPMESYINSGSLHFMLQDGQNLPIGDIRSSDPFVVLKLNGESAFKSKVIKKNLNPVWNEEADIVVQNRVLDVLELVCYDWDMGEKPDVLGTSNIDLLSLEPNVESQQSIKLDSKTGTINASLRFVPGWHRRKAVLDVTLADNFLHAANKGAKLVVGGVGAAGGLALAGVTTIGSVGSKAVTGVADGVTGTGKHIISGAKGISKMGMFRRSLEKNPSRSDLTTTQEASSSASVPPAIAPESANAALTSTIDKTTGAPELAQKKYKVYVGQGKNMPHKTIKIIVTDNQDHSFKTKSRKGPSPSWNEEIPVKWSLGDELRISAVTSNLLGHTKLGEAVFQEDAIGTFRVVIGGSSSVEIKVEAE